MDIKYTKVGDTYYEPYIGSACAAGADLKAVKDYTIYPGETVKVGTGIAVEIPDNYFGAIFARSGLATKKGLRPANCVGVVDSDYRGEIIVALHNDSDEKREIEAGERIAQLAIIPYLPVSYHYVDSLSETERGADGFGSTGTK
jgi:dUTP pyrophosphatase